MKNLTDCSLSGVLAALVFVVATCSYAAPYTNGDLTRCVLNMSQLDTFDNSFAVAKEKGSIELVIHRVSMGKDGYDAKYKERMEDAGDCGLMWGAYHFLRPDEDPVWQADHFIRTVLDARRDSGSHAPPKVLLVLDEEYFGRTHKFLPIHDLIRAINRVKEITGSTPVIYVGQDFLIEKLRLSELAIADAKLLSESLLWIARYAKSPEWPDNGIHTPWAMWDFWQYTGDGQGPGGVLTPQTIPYLGLVDAELNYFYGDRIQLRHVYSEKAWDYTLQRGITYESLKHRREATPFPISDSRSTGNRSN
jgi:GH25 family lysozyme M1 (1,4-beta-N-acetylmuramidase)